MNEPQDSLPERVARLEAAVTEIQTTLRQLQQAANKETAKTGAAPPAKTQAPKSPSRSRLVPTPISFDLLLNGEYWLNKVGIGLLLLGVAFLFKYSIDQGWLTPGVRVGFGLGLGIFLLGIGFSIQRSRPPFSQVLLGGSIGTFYITGFAAFQLYKLISYPAAFCVMVVVTLLAFFLSVRQNQAILSLIGTAGGLGTPFLLYTGTSSLGGLVGYTCLILAGTSAIYWRRGWRSLLWTSFLGAWAVFLTVAVGNMEAADLADRWVLQAGIVFGWLVFWGLPILREVFLSPQASPQLPTDSTQRSSSSKHPVHLLSVVTPVIALALSDQVWSLPDRTWGGVAIAVAAIYGLVALGLRNRHRSLANTQALVVFLFLAIALVLILEGEWLFLMLAAEAVVLHNLGRRLGDRPLVIAGHLLSAAIALKLIERLFYEAETPVIFNSLAVTDLGVLALALAGSIGMSLRDRPLIYRGFAHLAFLGWLWRELSALPDGKGYVTIAWGVYGILLLLIGRGRTRKPLRVLAMTTLLLVVVKLFLFDLTGLQAIWRILLFIGFGGVFLVLSYFLRDLWQPESDPPDPPTPGPNIRSE